MPVETSTDKDGAAESDNPIDQRIRQFAAARPSRKRNPIDERIRRAMRKDSRV